MVLGVQTSSRVLKIREAKVTAWECLPCRTDPMGREATGVRVHRGKEEQELQFLLADPRASRWNMVLGACSGHKGPLSHLPCQP